MNWHDLSVGLAQYLCVIVVITLHEFGHAWMARRCGDDTAERQGRVTLNPAAHIDPIGTIALPLIALALNLTGHGGIARFIIGWGKPVPVDYLLLRNIKRDSLLIAMAGPAMNLALTAVVMVLVRLAMLGGQPSLGEAGLLLSYISMYLFFFNMIPVPPLDGSHVMRFLISMKWETFMKISQYGFFIVIVLIQLEPVKRYLSVSTDQSVIGLAQLLRIY
jgi:Zn-dependent protease